MPMQVRMRMVLVFCVYLTGISVLCVHEIFRMQLRSTTQICSAGSRNDSTSEDNPNELRVFCWILTTSKNRFTKTIFLEDTWPRRCDSYAFFTDNNTELDPSRHIAIYANMSDGHNQTWPKTKAAISYIYEHHLNDFDYFVRGDDDTYIIVENLRRFLAMYNSSEHHYFGFKYSHELLHGHASGGAGSILSRSALKLLVEVLPDPVLCPDVIAVATGEIADDVQIARCLENLGIFLELTTDADGRLKFLPGHPDYLTEASVNEVSPDVIGMHYLEPKEYRFLDFFLYRLRRVPDTRKNRAQNHTQLKIAEEQRKP